MRYLSIEDSFKLLLTFENIKLHKSVLRSELYQRLSITLSYLKQVLNCRNIAMLNSIDQSMNARKTYPNRLLYIARFWRANPLLAKEREKSKFKINKDKQFVYVIYNAPINVDYAYFMSSQFTFH